MDQFMMYLSKKYPESTSKLSSFFRDDFSRLTQNDYSELKEMIGILKTKSQKIKNVQLPKLYAVTLKASIELNTYDNQLFFEFLEFCLITLDEQSEMNNNEETGMFFYVQNNYSRQRNMNKKCNITELNQKDKNVDVLKSYMKKLVKENDLEQLSKYVDIDILEKMRAKQILLRG